MTMGNAPTASIAPETPTAAVVTHEAGSVNSYAGFDFKPAGEREFVARITNPPESEGGRPFSMRYLTQVYTIPPGASTIVPWAVMVSFMGDPFAYNTARTPERENVLKRLQMKYGVYDNDEAWEYRKPTLIAESVLNGERIWTVLDDPKGVHFAQNAVTANPNTAALELQIQQMQNMIAQLMAQQQLTSGGPAPAAVENLSAPPAPGTPTGVTPAPAPAPAPGPAISPVAPTASSFTAPAVFDAPPPASVPLAPPGGATAPGNDVAQGALPDEPTGPGAV